MTESSGVVSTYAKRTSIRPKGSARSVAEALWFRNQYTQPRAALRRLNAPVTLRQLIAPLFLFSVLVLQLWARVSIIERGYTLEELRKTTLINDVALRQKRLEYAYITRPAHVGSEAKAKLGMTTLPPQRIRTIHESAERKIAKVVAKQQTGSRG